MSELEQKQTEFSAPNSDLPGARLRRAREGFHFAIEDIARNMHLKTEVVDLLERDEYEALSRSPVFIRGYIRGYAKLVDLDADELIYAFNQQYQDIPEEKPALEGHDHLMVSRDRPIRWVSYVVIAAVISLGTLWWHNQKLPESSQAIQVQAGNDIEIESVPADKSAAPHSHDTLRKSKSFVVKDRKDEAQEATIQPSKRYHREFKID